MYLKDSAKIRTLVKKTVAHYQKTRDFCIDLYKEAVEELYGEGPWTLTYLQVKAIHDQLRSLLVAGGLAKSSANSYLKACYRVVLFRASFEFGRRGSIQDIEKVQEKIKTYKEGTPQDKYDRAVKEVLQEKHPDEVSEPAFKVRARRHGEKKEDYIRLVEAELSNVLQQQVTIQLKTKRRRAG